MPDAPDARPGADFDCERTARAVVGLVNSAPLGVLPAAAPAPPRFVPTLPPWEAPVIDAAARDAARRRTQDRDVEVLVTAIVDRLVSEGYVARDAGPLDPNRERIGFRRR